MRCQSFKRGEESSLKDLKERCIMDFIKLQKLGAWYRQAAAPISKQRRASNSIRL